MTRRFWIGAVLTLPVFVARDGPHDPRHAFPALVDGSESHWIGLLLSTPVVFWAGWPFFVRAAQALPSIAPPTCSRSSRWALRRGWAYSVVATLAPGFFPASFLQARAVIETYFEAAAVIVTLVLLGQVLELRARGAKRGDAIRALLGLAPATARRVRCQWDRDRRAAR